MNQAKYSHPKYARISLFFMLLDAHYLVKKSKIFHTHQKRLDVFVVGEDAIVNNKELVVWSGALRMRVHDAGLAMSGPSGMRDADVCVKLLLKVDVPGA